MLSVVLVLPGTERWGWSLIEKTIPTAKRADGCLKASKSFLEPCWQAVQACRSGDGSEVASQQVASEERFERCSEPEPEQAVGAGLQLQSVSALEPRVAEQELVESVVEAGWLQQRYKADERPEPVFDTGCFDAELVESVCADESDSWVRTAGGRDPLGSSHQAPWCYADI